MCPILWPCTVCHHPIDVTPSCSGSDYDPMAQHSTVDRQQQPTAGLNIDPLRQSSNDGVSFASCASHHHHHICHTQTLRMHFQSEENNNNHHHHLMVCCCHAAETDACRRNLINRHTTIVAMFSVSMNLCYLFTINPPQRSETDRSCVSTKCCALCVFSF